MGSIGEAQAGLQRSTFVVHVPTQLLSNVHAAATGTCTCLGDQTVACCKQSARRAGFCVRCSW